MNSTWLLVAGALDLAFAAERRFLTQGSALPKT
jgi:hypothetical protein